MVLCPRCNQGEVFQARVRSTSEVVFICDECEATWIDKEKIGVGTFVSYTAYMENFEKQPLWTELEEIVSLD